MKFPAFKYLLICILFLTVSSQANAASFKYKSSEGRMSIKFPGQYTVVSEDKDYGKTVKINAEVGDYLFSASYTIHFETMSEHESLANVSLESFAESLEGKVEKKEAWSINKNRGVRAVVKSTELNITSVYCCILIGQIQYQLVVATTAESWKEESGEAFIKSFKVK